MTREEFQAASARVARYVSVAFVLGGSSIAVAEVLAFQWAEPSITPVRDLWHRSLPDWVIGILGGLIGGVVGVIPFLSLAPLIGWIDNQFGVRCPHCNGRVTLRCRELEVLRSGRCGLCHGQLFPPADLPVPTDDLSKPLPRHLLRWSIGLWVIYLVGMAIHARWLGDGLVVVAFGRLCLAIVAMIVMFVAGVALWTTVRLRSWRCLAAALLTVPLSALICWHMIRGL